MVQRSKAAQQKYIASGGLWNGALRAPGWLEGEAEAAWCSLIQKAIEKKIDKLPKFKPAAHHDLIVYDETPFIRADQQLVITTMRDWMQNLAKAEPRFEKVSIVISLDVIFDLGGECRLFPFVEWSELKPGDREGLMALSQRVEQAGQVAAERAIRYHAKMGHPVHFIDGRGRLIKQMPDGRRFELCVLDNGEEVVVKEL